MPRGEGGPESKDRSNGNLEPAGRQALGSNARHATEGLLRWEARSPEQSERACFPFALGPEVV